MDAEERLKSKTLYKIVLYLIKTIPIITSSIADEHHMALYIKDVVDDVDAPDGLIFNRWYADMCYKGIAIPWYDMI